MSYTILDAWPVLYVTKPLIHIHFYTSAYLVKTTFPISEIMSPVCPCIRLCRSYHSHSAHGPSCSLAQGINVLGSLNMCTSHWHCGIWGAVFWMSTATQLSEFEHRRRVGGLSDSRCVCRLVWHVLRDASGGRWPGNYIGQVRRGVLRSDK